MRPAGSMRSRHAPWFRESGERYAVAIKEREDEMARRRAVAELERYPPPLTPAWFRRNINAIRSLGADLGGLPEDDMRLLDDVESAVGGHPERPMTLSELVESVEHVRDKRSE